MKSYLFLALVFGLNLTSIGQSSDYITKSLKQFEQSLVKKDYALMDTLLAPSYKLGTYDKTVAGQVIPQIFAQYPSIKGIAFEFEKENKAWKAIVDYTIPSSGNQHSNIYFNSKGKIVSIDLFDEILAMSNTRDRKSGESETMFVNDQPFLSREELTAFYNKMVEEIETLDAEGIAVRNAKKQLKWKKLKRYHQKRFVGSVNWEELNTNYNAFANGFVNLHSHFTL